jgi:predicted GNAT family N-acyltransferase
MILKSPAECSSEELALFARFVRDGGEVQSQGLPGRIRQAKALAFLVENGQAIGIAALKQPNQGYRAGVFAKAKAIETPDRFPYEVGWVVIDEKHRGRKLSRALVDAVLSRSEGCDVFATSVTTRKFMHRTLMHFDFAQHGQPYPSSQRDEDLFLFIRTNVQSSTRAEEP